MYWQTYFTVIQYCCSRGIVTLILLFKISQESFLSFSHFPLGTKGSFLCIKALEFHIIIITLNWQLFENFVTVFWQFFDSFLTVPWHWQQKENCGIMSMSKVRQSYTLSYFLAHDIHTCSDLQNAPFKKTSLCRKQRGFYLYLLLRWLLYCLCLRFVS